MRLACQIIHSPFGRSGGCGDDSHVVEVGGDAGRTLAATEELVGLATLGREQEAARIKEVSRHFLLA